MASEEEMAEMHKLSNDYAPTHQGVDVGRRQSSQAIADVYTGQDTDPIFGVKTKALCIDFPVFRAVKGDGNCGWTALAFGYCETLLHAQNRTVIDEERARLESLNRLLDEAGHPRDLYEDFIQSTFDLLDAIAARLPCRDDGKDLLERFNKDGVCSAIITHFRLVTSAWLKSHATLYKAFLLDGSTIEQYCATHIEPYQVEIEHLGIDACINAILKPAGISVDVSYLDRSVGEVVNTFNWQGDFLEGRAGLPTVRLLYRPGHYDLLYKFEDFQNILPPPDEVSEVRVVHDIPQANLMESTYMDPWSFNPALTFIPGFSLSLPLETPYFDDVSTPMLFPGPDIPGPMYSPPPPTMPEPAFRRSVWQNDVDYDLPPCTTEPMKQAGESPAHYMNPNFQPYIWSSSEYKSGRDAEPHNRR